MKTNTILYIRELIKAQEDFSEPLVGWYRREHDAYIKGLKDMWGLVISEAYTQSIPTFEELLERAEDK